MKRRFPFLIGMGIIICFFLAFLVPGSMSFPQSHTIYTITTLQPTPTHIIASIPTPIPTPPAVLTAVGKPAPLPASVAYLIDSDTGNILYDQQGEHPQLMASTTKIMTALIALQTGNLNQSIPVGPDAVNHIVEDDGSSAQLQVGDTLSLKEMLYALLLPSGDDAAYAIADALSGSPAAFVAHMNLFAQRLHLYQTHFNSPDGLTNDGLTHYSTAHDLALLAQDAMQIPLFAQIVQTQSHTVQLRTRTLTWTNTNTLLGSYPGMEGIKTGHTNDSGYCLVFAATRNGHHLLGVVLGSPDEKQRNQAVVTLLNWGFALPMRQQH